MGTATTIELEKMELSWYQWLMAIAIMCFGAFVQSTIGFGLGHLTIKTFKMESIRPAILSMCLIAGIAAVVRGIINY